MDTILGQHLSLHRIIRQSSQPHPPPKKVFHRRRRLSIALLPPLDKSYYYDKIYIEKIILHSSASFAGRKIMFAARERRRKLLSFQIFSSLSSTKIAKFFGRYLVAETCHHKRAVIKEEQGTIGNKISYTIMKSRFTGYPYLSRKWEKQLGNRDDNGNRKTSRE